MGADWVSPLAAAQTGWVVSAACALILGGFYPWLSGELSAFTSQPTGPASAESSLACRLSQSLPLCAPQSPSTRIPAGPGLTKRGLRCSHPNGTDAAGQRQEAGPSGSQEAIPSHLPFPDRIKIILAASG